VAKRKESVRIARERTIGLYLADKAM